MAVSLITRIRRYQGLSSDSKPTSGVITGSTFLETDTGARYVFDGSAWNAYERDLEGQLNDILAILGTTKTLLVPGWESEGSIISAIGAAGFVPSDEAGANALQTYFSPIQMPCRLHHYGFVKTENHHFSGADNAAFSFDGAGDAPFSGGAWIRPNKAVLAQEIIAKWDEALAEEYRFSIGAAGKLIFELYDATNNDNELATADTVLTPGQFIFVVFTYDGVEATPEVHLYINGVDDNPTGATVEGGAAYAQMDDTATPLLIGASDLTASPANEFDGRLAIPFLCGKELTAAEVVELYNMMLPMVGFS